MSLVRTSYFLLFYFSTFLHRRPGQHPAAVDEVSAAGRVGAVVRSEEDGHRRDVGWSARPPENDLRLSIFEVIGIVLSMLVHRCEDHAGSNVVDRDPVFAKLDREG